ncbi:MAG TPA: cytochrome c [Thermoanaerobaculia bacterium]|nr:cytochrome c [Thermoanaerobaculia bacterium]
MKSARILGSVLSLSLLVVPAVMAAESPAKEAAEGKKTFDVKCKSCHGPEGKADTTMAKNMKIKAFESKEVQEQSKEALYKTIEDGKGKMPSYKGKLNKDQINDLVDYIKSLAPKK